MKPSAFMAVARQVYGHFGWKVRVAEANNVAPSTVYRWGTGEIPLPDSAVDRLRKDAAEKAAALVTAAFGA